jgi:hypothetical protein
MKRDASETGTAAGLNCRGFKGRSRKPIVESARILAGDHQQIRLGKGPDMDKKYAIGAAVAVGMLVLVPGLAAALTRAGQPLKRAALRSGAVAWDEFRRAGAEAFEHMEDLAAEFRAEVATRQAEAAAAETAAATATAPANGQDAT